MTRRRAKKAAASQTAPGSSVRGMTSPRIVDVSVITTAPAGLRLCVVKVTTDRDGLYGYGCATFTQRAELVAPAVERYLKPFLMGRPADRIEDIWHACYNSSYWRNGPVLNSAISGVDQALWDIKGRMLGTPVYQLLGGKCREAAACYAHVSGAEAPEVIDKARQFLAEGFRHLRVQVGLPGMEAFWCNSSYSGGAPVVTAGGGSAPSLHDSPVYEPAVYIRRSLRLLEACRCELDEDVELIHDVHERLSPTQGLQFAKDVERFKLFFLEDLFSPEDLGWLRLTRQQCATPMAMGELFNSPHEWTPLIAERLIDYIRVHVSQAGGVTPCRKIAALGEAFGVKTAWHGPADVSPVGHAANVALDLACYNFGIQEYTLFDERVREVFPGTLVARSGYLYANEAPGWGIEVDERLAGRYPFGTGEEGDRRRYNGGWGDVRRMDGTIVKQ